MYNNRVEEKNYTLTEFQDLATIFAKGLKPRDNARVIALFGDLGAGKTTFVQSLARALGITGEVISPTFVIQKYYALEDQVFSSLIHIDAYRLENAHELEVLGWADIARDPTNLIVIEWPENVDGLLTSDAQQLHFKYIDETTRSVSIGS
ncbi:tRNA (adenosine(37)-N6)-threonylcarbamoyltransferase complex ATPase subunit type 1 TsaE [Candidatus Kaiserbacteria bacterium]|nr:MAG: tRNA (adenosine(37)-N6)-threonylcarbamoyltransferase complex ATPase subunit type 1 TsaE [Candidatus Kaiserbacteria bacterium]